MIARTFGSLALGLGLTLASFAPATAATKFTNWVMTTTFQDDGSTLCALRAGIERGGHTFSVDGRVPRKKINVVPYVAFGALPQLLAGKTGTIRNVTLTVGSWQTNVTRATWSRGSAENNSRISVPLTVKDWPALLNAVAGASSASLTFQLVNGTHSFPVNIKPDSAPAAAMAECLN